MRFLNPTRTGCSAAAALAVFLAVGGCTRSEPKTEVFSLKGKIEKIERTGEKTGKLTVLYFSDKQQQETLGTGLVTPETEIKINGALATLADLREGDRVRGEVRVEKKGGKRVLTALTIRVNRPKPSAKTGQKP